MKARKIGEDREARFAARRFVQQVFPHALQGGILLCDFDNSYQGDFGAVGYEFDAGIAHASSAHAEELNVSARPQCRREPRRVHVAGCFAGGDEDLCGRHCVAQASACGFCLECKRTPTG